MRRLPLIAASVWLLAAASGAVARGGASDERRGPVILAYHRFETKVADSMAVTTSRFASQLDYLAEHHAAAIPLRSVVEALAAKRPLPSGVVITVDDGHRTVYTDMLPLVRRHRIPVTLFIYPSAISNAAYAMTWPQLQELKDSGLFDIESHTYWHPNFKTEKRRLTPDAYEEFVRMQLGKPRQVLKTKLGTAADLLAWPFGIFDDDLMSHAAAAGYVAAFTLQARSVSPSDRLLALPRFLMTEGVSDKRFAAIVGR